MKVKIKYNEFDEINVSGSPTHDEYVALENARKLVNKKYEIQLDSLRGLTDKEKIVDIRERLAPYFLEMDQTELSFFDQHPRSYVTAYWLRYYVSKVSIDSMIMFYERLGENIQKCPLGKYLAQKIEKRAGGSPGTKSKDFTATNINGNKLRLSDLMGKYVLLDFWASWCIPCRKSTPHLIDLFKKYQESGLDVIGISGDENINAWKKAVEIDNIKIWYNLLSNEQRNGTIKIHEIYGVYLLPTLILIDKSGIIIARYTGTEEEVGLDKKLMEVFHKEEL